MRDTYAKGKWNVLCDRCDFKYKSSSLRREWNGLMTCSGDGTNDCFETRHPQDFVKAKADRQTPRWVRPEAPDVFVTEPITGDDL